MSSYTAIVATVDNTYPIEGADRIVHAVVSGYNVIIASTWKAGDIGILFPAGGRISDKYLLANNLYRKHPVTSEPMGGFFEASGRVLTVKMRGVLSEAFFAPLETLSCMADYEKVKSDLVPGYQLTHVGSEELCTKYYSKETLKLIRERGPAAAKASSLYDEMFPKHYDTPHFRNVISQVRSAWDTFESVYLTEKYHGTSGRTTYQYAPETLGPWQSLVLILKTLWAWILGSRDMSSLRSLPLFQRPTLALGGTRNTILALSAPGEKGKGFRHTVNDTLVGLLKDHYGPGYTLYYEIVGWESRNGTPIMAPHYMNKQTEKAFGKDLYTGPILYSYGADKDSECPWEVIIYRATYTHPQTGEVRELSLAEVEVLATTLGKFHFTSSTVNTYFPIKSPEILAKRNPDYRFQTLLDLIIHYLESDCASLRWQGQHPREGICIRTETTQGVHRVYKWKTPLFSMLEEIAVHTVDKEDIS